MGLYMILIDHHHFILLVVNLLKGVVKEDTCLDSLCTHLPEDMEDTPLPLNTEDTPHLLSMVASSNHTLRIPSTQVSLCQITPCQIRSFPSNIEKAI